MSAKKHINPIVIIPARTGSSRLPGKPLVELDGVPMVVRVARQAQGAIENVWVASDSEVVVKTAREYLINAVYVPEPCTNGTERCILAYEKILADHREYAVNCTHMINVQGDEPLLLPDHLHRLMEGMRMDTGVRITTLCTPLTQDVMRTYGIQVMPIGGGNAYVVVDVYNNALYFSRFPIPYVHKSAAGVHPQFPVNKHIGVYGFEIDVLSHIQQMAPIAPVEVVESLEQNRWLYNFMEIRVYFHHVPTVAVNTHDDLSRVRRIIKFNSLYK